MYKRREASSKKSMEMDKSRLKFRDGMDLGWRVQSQEARQAGVLPVQAGWCSLAREAERGIKCAKEVEIAVAGCPVRRVGWVGPDGLWVVSRDNGRNGEIKIDGHDGTLQEFNTSKRHEWHGSERL